MALLFSNVANSIVNMSVDISRIFLFNVMSSKHLQKLKWGISLHFALERILHYNVIAHCFARMRVE